jgi:hypothetical protein
MIISTGAANSKAHSRKTGGQVRFPSAVATMEASADALLVTIETDDTESVEQLEELVANHR